MKQAVCLITPPSMFLMDERVFMSLGILRVAAVLEEQGIPVEMVDLSGVANYPDAVRDHARATSADVFGLTATTPQMPAAMAVCAAIRAVRPDARIILGGPHVTLVNAARRQEGAAGREGRASRAFAKLAACFDVLVAGDGEAAIFQALQSRPPKLIDADEPRSELFLQPARLAELPQPARHLVDVDSYHYTIEGIRALSLICQLGCPFGCNFCGGRDSPSLRRVRLRPVQSVVDELLHLYRTYQVRGFMLYDDELNVNPKMVELMNAIAQNQRELGCEFRLRGFIKAELFTDDQAAAMYKAGFRWILTGFESGSPRILKNINKRATVEENTRCVAIAHRHGLKVKALMSMGHPGESRDTVRETYAWLLEVKPDDFDMTVLSVYPGSPYYDRAVPDEANPHLWVYTVNGDKLYSQEIDYTEVSDYYKGDPNSGYSSYVYTDYLSAAEIVELRDFVETDVRRILGIPFQASAAAVQYDHSMGQRGALPQHILRTSAVAKPATGGAGPVLVRIQQAGSAGLSADTTAGKGQSATKLRKVRKESQMDVVILCGGKGTRSYPFTEYFPKVMMPIRGTPILIHLMRLYAAQGFKSFVLAAGYRKEILDDYFAGRFPEWKVQVVDTGSESDTGERVRRCEPYLSDTFFATYGDGLGNVNLRRLLTFHRESAGLATVTSVPLRSQYGTVHFSNAQQVTNFREKPVIRDYWINAGFFVFEKSAFRNWKGNNLEAHVLPQLAARGELYTYLHEGFWKSMDTSKDQQEMETVAGGAVPPWMELEMAAVSGAD